MLILVTGGSGSGKSAFAEELAVKLSGNNPLVYLATMRVFDEEGEKRVLRHREQRKEKGFTTLELPSGLGGARIPSRATVLLEDLANLTLNEFYEEEEECAERVLHGIRFLSGKAGNLILVTNEIGASGEHYPEETERFLDHFFRVNRDAGKMADEVYEVVFGIPLKIKGQEV